MEPAPTVSAVHDFLLPTDFQALSFTSPQWPAKPVTHDERGIDHTNSLPRWNDDAFLPRGRAFCDATCPGLCL